MRWKAGQVDPEGQAVVQLARDHCGQVDQVRTSRVYLIQAPLDDPTVRRIGRDLLADPVTQEAIFDLLPASPRSATVEVHYKPGVMDPASASARDAIVQMVEQLQTDQIEVRTAVRYDLIGTEASAAAVLRFAKSALANTVIQTIYLEPVAPASFPTSSPYRFKLVHVELGSLDRKQLESLSRQHHLFLNGQEMLAIQRYFRTLGRQPTDVELETIAQTWSEHCVHKTLKSTIHYSQPEGAWAPGPSDWLDRPGHELQADGSLLIHNLFKSTIVAATRKLMDAPGASLCISVFEDNAGIVRFDADDAVCIKVETHNHPSAIEPYGGAATGIGGCIRDVLGTGLAARPVATTDVFCVANEQSATLSVPEGVIRPRRILQQVVAGVRDYGNRMGIPTVNGAVSFDDSYVANPLVFCGCVGLLPISHCFGQAASGDHIIAVGGRTGRDGIHGATFSSAELTDRHGAEFAHAVQIGNAITQKKMLDVILQARDAAGGPLFSAITDCGAGGFSSAVGEMGRKVGANVKLEQAPLKYEGLSYTEIWISEAQERMVLAVPARHLQQLGALCRAEDVEYCDLGQYGSAASDGRPQLCLTYQGHEVGRLDMGFVHEGLPTPTRRATWGPVCPTPAPARAGVPASIRSIGPLLGQLLADPNIASKQWIVRQYDHEVQGASVVKPLTGPHQDGPSDAAVLRPKLSSRRGIALGCGLQPQLSESSTGRGADQGDSYWATLAAIDEAIRNVVCVGADPTQIALLDNFCWASCEDPAQLGSLVRAAQACYDGALAYRSPFISGKDSLSNQFVSEKGKLITIAPTLLVTALGIVPNVARCCTMDAKSAGNCLLVAGLTTGACGGSRYMALTADTSVDRSIPTTDLQVTPRTAQVVSACIGQDLILSAHDCSEGGLLVAAAEMAFAGRVGLELQLSKIPGAQELDPVSRMFAETPGRYLLEVRPSDFDEVAARFQESGVDFGLIGTFTGRGRLVATEADLDESLDELRAIWQAQLDW